MNRFEQLETIDPNYSASQEGAKPGTGLHMYAIFGMLIVVACVAAIGPKLWK